MKLSKKKEVIQALKEDEFREKILIPLFSKMGFIDPILHHHNNEKGKDIILKEYDNKFKKTLFLAVVVKAGDVTGSSSSSSSYFALLNQIKQAINEPYKHVYELKEVHVDQVIVVISGKFLPTALESIYATLKQERIDKAIREPIDINKLPALIDEHFPEYWSEYDDENSSLLTQRNYLLNNITKLSKVLFPDSKEQEKFLNTVAMNDFDVSLFANNTISKYVANIGYRSINIDEIDEFYSDNTISNGYCNIREHFFEVKEKAKKILYQMDDVIEILKKILDEKDPSKLDGLSEDLNSYIGGYGQRGLQFSTHDIEYQDDFTYALKEYSDKKNVLINSGLSELYKSTYLDLSNRAIVELTNFYREHSKDEKNEWLGFKLIFNLDQKSLRSIEAFTFREEPRVLRRGDNFSPSKEIERYSIEGSGIIRIEIAVNNFGIWKEDELTSERKARNFVWHFERGFELKFLEMIGYVR